MSITKVKTVKTHTASLGSCVCVCVFLLILLAIRSFLPSRLRRLSAGLQYDKTKLYRGENGVKKGFKTNKLADMYLHILYFNHVDSVRTGKINKPAFDFWKMF